MCRECQVKHICNGDRMFYENFDELSQELVEKFKGSNSTKSKKSYVELINMLNANGHTLIGDYVGGCKYSLINFNCGHGIRPFRPSKYKTGQRCSACMGQDHKYNKKCFRELVITNGHTLLTEYENNVTKVLIDFHCGHGAREIKPVDYKNGVRCNICANREVKKGDNDIATTDPHLVKFFANPEDAYTHTRCSYKKVDMICPNCGCIKKEVTIANLTRQGFSCSECGDGVSYPEKVFANFLNYLIKQGVIDCYVKQKRFEGYNYLYDFTLYKDDKIVAIVETHGEQHYKEIKSWVRYGGKTLEQEQANDKAKEELANINGYVTNERYFIIDCRKSNIEWISNNIKSSKLIEKLNVDLKNIDWEDIDKKSQCSLKWEVVTKWIERKSEDINLTPKNLADELGMCYATVQHYLKWGNEHVEDCHYDIEQELELNNERNTKYSVYFLNSQGERIYEDATSMIELERRTNISRTTLKRSLGQPLGTRKGANNVKFDVKYIGCKVVLASEYDKEHGSN